MERDMITFKEWENFHRHLQREEFERKKEKAIQSAMSAIDNAADDSAMKSCEGLLRKAVKMQFQFDRDGLINYGNCNKFNKQVSFLPQTCQIATQQCFVHRKDFAN